MTRLDLLVIVHPYPPTPSSGAHRWGAIVKYLRRAGHDVRVVTSGSFGPLEDEAPLVDIEHLQLTLQEAFFLLWNLDCLTVLDPQTVSRSPNILTYI